MQPKLKDPIPNLTPIFQPNHQTLEGSFSSASKPIFAPKYAFCSIKFFRELQDLQSFAPLQFQKSEQNSVNLCSPRVSTWHGYALILSEVEMGQPGGCPIPEAQRTREFENWGMRLEFLTPQRAPHDGAAGRAKKIEKTRE